MSASKMVNVLPRPYVRLMTPAFVAGEISPVIILIGQDQMVELLAQELDLAVIIPMARIKVRETLKTWSLLFRSWLAQP